jgi:hypothetical protein
MLENENLNEAEKPQLNIGAVMCRYLCINCGNTCLSEVRPNNSICGGCKNPNWKLKKQQESYQVGGIDYIHKDGEV